MVEHHYALEVVESVHEVLLGELQVLSWESQVLL